MAYAHVGVARVLHNGLHVLEVQVDDTGQLDQVGDGLHALAQHVVGGGEGVGQGDALLAHQLQPLVGDDHQGVHVLPQGGDALFRLLHTAAALESEGFGDDAHGEGPQLPGDFGHLGGSPRAGAAAHAGGDEHHVGVLEHIGDGLAALLGSLLAHLGLRAGAPAAGELLAQLHLYRSLGTLQGLLIRIHANQLHAAHTGAGDAVYGVAAAAAHTHHFDGLWSLIKQIINFKRHVISSLAFYEQIFFTTRVPSTVITYDTTWYNLSLLRENFKKFLRKRGAGRKFFRLGALRGARGGKNCEKCRKPQPVKGASGMAPPRSVVPVSDPESPVSDPVSP